jgi:hypothetical protein
MSDAPRPAAPADAPKSGWQKGSRWILIAAGVIMMLSGGIKLLTYFFPSLPSCSSDTATAVLRNIFKSKNVEVTSLSGLKTVTDTADEKTCEGQIETPAERATIYYRIYWQNRDVTVMITKVDTRPK